MGCNRSKAADADVEASASTRTDPGSPSILRHNTTLTCVLKDIDAIITRPAPRSFPLGAIEDEASSHPPATAEQAANGPLAAAALADDEPSNIPLEELETIGLLGVGTYGRVRLVRHMSRACALKVINKGGLSEEVLMPNSLRQVLSERWVLQHACKHPFLPRLLGAYQDTYELYMLTEAHLGGTLANLLGGGDGAADGGLPSDSVRFYAACICAALEHLHSRGVVYRDLKTENVLLNAKGYACVIDMGFAKYVGPAGLTKTMLGTAAYVAPEMYCGGGEGYGVAADWWAFGVLLYELRTTRTPFEGWTGFGVVQEATKALSQPGGLPLPPATFVDELSELIGKLLVLDPSQRLGMTSPSADGADGAPPPRPVRAAPFLSSLDFGQLVSQALPAPFVPNVDGATDLRHSDAGLAEPDLSGANAEWELRVREQPLYGRVFESWEWAAGPCDSSIRYESMRASQDPLPPPPNMDIEREISQNVAVRRSRTVSANI